MDWRFTTNFILLLIATALAIRLAYYAWRRRLGTGMTLFTLLVLAIAQTAALLFWLLVPWVGDNLSLMGLSSQKFTAFTFLISGMILVHFTLRFRLFDIAPIAHRAIVNSMTDGIIVLDKQDRIADINNVAAQIMEQPAEELVGKSFRNVWPNLAAIFSEALEESVEINSGSQESPCFYEVTVSPLYGWRQKQRGYLISLHDITRRKELESIREDMVQTMVHELRDPLSNSLFALEMLRGDMSFIDLPEGGQLLELTFAQTMKTLQLVDKILEIGRLNKGVDIVITRTAFTMQNLIERVINAQTSRTSEKHLTITYDVPDTLPYAWADVGLVERVIENLLDNSIKYSPGGGTIHVKATTFEGNRNSDAPKIMVTVSDEGPGIPNDFQEKIFDKFVTGSEKWSGTGLGLAFCKMAIKAQGGNIWVESDAGSGSKFVFSLPVSLEPALVLEPA